MLKLLFFSAVRVSALVRVKVTDIDFAQCKIFIAQGKGRKDRYILFPTSFCLVLQSHLRANPKNRYLFETVRYTSFTPRRIQQIVRHYRDQAGIVHPVHPHLFRHQLITYLTTQGLSDSQIQLIWKSTNISRYKVSSAPTRKLSKPLISNLCQPLCPW
jgi:site-specific recombinase XerD